MHELVIFYKLYSHVFLGVGVISLPDVYPNELSLSVLSSLSPLLPYFPPHESSLLNRLIQKHYYHMYHLFHCLLHRNVQLPFDAGVEGLTDNCAPYS